MERSYTLQSIVLIRVNEKQIIQSATRFSVYIFAV